MLFTFPSRYSSTIGLTGVFSLAGWSRRIRTGFLVPRATQDPTTAAVRFGYGAVTRCGATFQTLLLASTVRRRGPTTPGERMKHSPRFGLVPVRSPLLGESLLFSLPGGTKMFQFPPFASARHTCGWPPFRRPGCPIRIPAGQRSFAPHRGLSQLIASFIASVSQGIRHAPLHAFPRRAGPPEGARARSYFQLLLRLSTFFVHVSFL